MSEPAHRIPAHYLESIEPVFNPWVGTTMEFLATHGSKKSGCYYETHIAKPILENYGFDVTKSTDSTGPWDLKIVWTNQNGEEKLLRVEVKVGRSCTDHKKKCVDNYNCILNHIGLGKDFDILFIVIIILVDGEAAYKERWCTKSDLINHIESPNSLFVKQQGGAGGDNDDWMCSGKTKIKKLLKEPIFKTIDTLKLLTP